MRTSLLLTFAAVLSWEARVDAQSVSSFDGCVAEALTQSAAVRPDGSFRINNVPTATGQIFSVLITCPTAQGGTVRALSPPIVLARRQNLVLPPFAFADRGVDLMQLSLRAPVRTLARVGDRVFTVVAGEYPDGTVRNLTYPQTGTSFRSSNPNVAIIDATGCVVAAAPGVASIAAFNSGRTASVRISVSGGPDSDGDGMPDACEIANGFDPVNPTDAGGDPDADGLTNAEECANGTNPFDADTDADGLDDGAEVDAQTDPVAPDTDGDGLLDGDEIARGTDPLDPNSDGDCLPDGAEVLLGTNPLMAGDDQGDRDGDGLTNCAEAAIGTNPIEADSDGDGILDGEEVVSGADGFITDPLDADSDDDGMSDGVETAFGSNPTDGNDIRTEVVLDGRTVAVSGPIRLNSLTLRNGAVLSTVASTASSTSLLQLELAGTLTIDASSRIDVSARGFLGGRAAGNPADSGRTLGNVPGSQRRTGGSYGGLGTLGNVDAPANSVYGDFRDPNEPGSGGASESGAGGNGGGLARISALALVLDGEIAADGGEGLGGIAAGGSGGAIRLDVGTLSGGGRIHANGGVGDDQLDEAGGGGGGRVAVYYNALQLAADRIEAFGGAGPLSRVGGSGTIYLKQRSAMRGQLIVRGDGIETPLPEAIAGDDVLLDAATVSVQVLQPNALSLVNGAVLTHPGSSTTVETQLAIDAATVSIDAMSRIDVSARGFLGGRAGENVADTGRTFGNVAGSRRRTGGSYGGLGALGNANAPANTVYGDFRNPNEPGSGGASESGAGGNGGGLLRLTAATLSLDGELAADGGEGLGGLAAGGSGGGIRLDVGTLAGGGIIHANGGPGDDQLDEAGGGGGGRIAIHYANAGAFDFANVEALGGASLAAQFAGVGTVYLESAAQSGGELILDNGDRVTQRATPLFSLNGDASTALGANSLTDAAAAFVPGTLIGVELRPNAALLQTFTVVANDTTTLFTDPTDGDLRAMAAVGEAYAAEPVLDRVAIARRAIVEVLDGDENRADRRGFLTAGALAVSETARLQHPAATTLSTFGLELDIDGELRVDASSRIDVSARGFLGGRSGDNGADPGRTLGNVPGSTRRNGGSYGGLGAFGNEPVSTINPVYGDFRNPDEPGSGGASESGAGGGGGGVIRIVADSAVVDGEIAADGGDGQGGIAAGGSGGAIRLDLGTLAGAGGIHANGGPGDDQLDEAGGGGGGRVAIYYDDATQFDLDAKVNVAPGPGSSGNAAPGSVFLRRRSDAQGQLRIRGTGRETPLASGFGGEHLLLDGARVSAGTAAAASLTLRNGAVLTHAGATGASSSNLALTVAGTLTVDATSRIDVSARGFLGARTVGNPDDTGRTLGNVPGSQRRTGGSYGGLGTLGNANAPANSVYGDFRNPNEPGSGGASESGSGGNGGGLARITAATLALAGEIAADGGDGQGNIAAGGSGGALRLDVGTLSGTGRIHANGGPGDDQLDEAGGGGGGRVAVYYDALQLAANRIEAFGAAGPFSRVGGSGSIYLKQRTAMRGQLIVRGAGIETPLTEGITTDDVLLDAATVSVQALQPNGLTLTNGAVLTHPGASITTAPHLAINAATVNIDMMSRIDVSARGFLGGRAGDNGADTGRTLGNVAGSQRRTGGSYGGLGALGNADAPANSVYGDFRNPNEPGSGGASESGGGGNGGGLVRLQATSLTLNGQILADGGDGQGSIAAGGSGGGIWVQVGTLSGAGAMHANGGPGDDQLDEAGGGGGGRVAIHYTNAAGFDFAQVQALGGPSLAALHAGVGTVYLESAAQSGGDLILDNAARATLRATPLYSLQGTASTGLTANSLTDTAASFVPGTLMGLELRPNAAQAARFTVVANNATTLFTDPADGNLTAAAAAGNSYTAEPALDTVEIARRAIVEVLDGDASHADRRGQLTAGTLAISETSVLQHPTATITSTFGLDLSVDGPLSVDQTSRIDASARGFLGGRAGDNSGDPGRTLGNVAGSTRRNGGSYGGLGGGGNVAGVSNPPYGSAQDPDDPGSGGASESGAGGNGGGLIRIAADSILLDGQITADGGDGLGGIAAGGSGGAIRLDTDTLAGTGTIHANGGPGDDQLDEAGGGGGGRVAVYAADASGFPLGNVTTSGGPGFSAGQPGTVHVAP